MIYPDFSVAVAYLVKQLHLFHHPHWKAKAEGMADVSIGRQFLHYKIERELGAGGMGVVYQAVDVRLGRPVALKFLPSEVSHVEHLKRRFETEAKAAAALDHVNVGTVYGVEEADDGRMFIVLAFYEGGNPRCKDSPRAHPAQSGNRLCEAGGTRSISCPSEAGCTPGCQAFESRHHERRSGRLLQRGVRRVRRNCTTAKNANPSNDSCVGSGVETTEWVRPSTNSRSVLSEATIFSDR